MIHLYEASEYNMAMNVEPESIATLTIKVFYCFWCGYTSLPHCSALSTPTDGE
jgi:hypothetical protein